MKNYLINTILILSILLTPTITYSAWQIYPHAGGTGTGTTPNYGEILVGNSSGTYDVVATSTLGTTVDWGTITGTLSNQIDLQNALDAKFSLTDWFATTTDGLDEGLTNLYYSTELFASDLAGTTTDALSEGSTNFYSTQSRWDGFMTGTTTLPTITTLVNLTDIITTNATTTNATTTTLAITNLTNCDTIDTDANGVLSCGTDDGGDSFSWTPDTTYNENANSTSTPLWLKDSLYASSTSFFTGLATFDQASTSQISANTSYLGTVSSGTWNGDTIAVANGGTGLTSYTLGDVLYASGTGTLAGTTTANLKTTLALNNVENTALSTWTGSSNITTLGTVTTGTIDSPNAVTAPNFVADSATATSTFAGGLTVDTSDFVVDPDSGRVGIGTVSPDAILDIEGEVGTSNIMRMSSLKNRNVIDFYSTTNSDVQYQMGAIEVDRASATLEEATMIFYTNGGSGSTEQMRIDPDGNVGIGQTSLSAKLDIVATNAEDSLGLEINQLDTGATNAVNIINAGTGSGLFIDQNGEGRGLIVNQDGDSEAIFIDQNANNDAILVDAENTTSAAMNVSSDIITAGNILYLHANSEDYTSTTGLLRVLQDNILASGKAASFTNDGTGDGILIDQNGNGLALNIDSEATSANIAVFNGDKKTGGIGVDIRSNSTNYTGTDGLLRVLMDNASASSVALKVLNDGTGNGILIDQNNDGRALNIDSESTSADTIFVSADIITSGSVAEFRTSSDSHTSQNVLIFNGHADSTAEGLKVQNVGTGNGILIDQDGNGIALNIDSEASSAVALQVDTVATSTINCKSSGAGLGCRFILEDTDGAGCTELTTLNGVGTFKIVSCI